MVEIVRPELVGLVVETAWRVVCQTSGVHAIILVLADGRTAGHTFRGDIVAGSCRGTVRDVLIRGNGEWTILTETTRLNFWSNVNEWFRIGSVGGASSESWWAEWTELTSGEEA